MKIFKYFFYKIYCFSLSNGQKDYGWAFTIVSIFLLLNLYSLFDIYLIILNQKLPQVGNPTIIIFSSIVLYLNYVLLIKNGKIPKMLNEFNDINFNKLKFNIYLLVYVILSISTFIVTGNIVRNLN